VMDHPVVVVVEVEAVDEEVAGAGVEEGANDNPTLDHWVTTIPPPLSPEHPSLLPHPSHKSMRPSLSGFGPNYPVSSTRRTRFN